MKSIGIVRACIFLINNILNCVAEDDGGDGQETTQANFPISSIAISATAALLIVLLMIIVVVIMIKKRRKLFRFSRTSTHSNSAFVNQT